MPAGRQTARLFSSYSVRKLEHARPLFQTIENCAKNRATVTESPDIAKLFGSGSGHGPLFQTIENCAKNRATGTELLDIAKLFGSGSGHSPLFHFSMVFAALY
ncbi:MAG: hypothetical protein SO031_01490 [Candidatus Ventricola sp.]|nr:hypothetical protein [Candidatus Ventricola sp.]